MMKNNDIDINNVVVHAPYIVNLANIDNFDFSVSFLKGEVERCAELGIKKMVYILVRRLIVLEKKLLLILVMD